MKTEHFLEGASQLREMAVVLPVHPSCLELPEPYRREIHGGGKQIPRIDGPFEKGRSHLLYIRIYKMIATTPELLREWRPGPGSVVGLEGQATRSGQQVASHRKGSGARHR